MVIIKLQNNLYPLSQETQPTPVTKYRMCMYDHPCDVMSYIINVSKIIYSCHDKIRFICTK